MGRIIPYSMENMKYVYIAGWWFFATPLKNDGVRQLGWWHSQHMEKLKMFQTTNQTNQYTYLTLPWTWPIFCDFGIHRPFLLEMIVSKNMVRAPAGALYCLRFSKCISSHLIHTIVENPWFWTLIIKNVWHAHVQKRGTARSKMSAFIRIHCVFPCICRPRRKSPEFQNFFSTFHAVCLCRAYPGSWKRGPHWSDATVHAIGISTMRHAISLIFPLDSRLYVTPAYMTLSHPPHPTLTPPHLQTC